MSFLWATYSWGVATVVLRPGECARNYPHARLAIRYVLCTLGYVNGRRVPARHVLARETAKVRANIRESFLRGFRF